MDRDLEPQMDAGEGLDEKLDRLVRLLETHAELHRRLLKIMEEKKTLLVQIQIEELEDVVAAEQAAIEVIAETERERIALTEEVGSALGLPPRRTRLLDLINRVEDPHRELLLEVRDDLRNIADEMDRLNRLNRTLVLHSLEHVHLFLSMLKGSDPHAKTYNQGGEEGGKPESILLDRRI
jgi:flagellar biosynthesis/type III secretory pathway chaperone